MSSALPQRHPPVVLLAQLKRLTVVVEVAKELKPNMEKQEVHKLGEHCRRVHSSIGFYSPSWTYLSLDFSPQVVDSSMEDFFNPS